MGEIIRNVVRTTVILNSLGNTSPLLSSRDLDVIGTIQGFIETTQDIINEYEFSDADLSPQLNNLQRLSDLVEAGGHTAVEAIPMAVNQLNKITDVIKNAE